MREKVQPLPGDPPVIKTILIPELDVHFLLQVPGPHLHDGAIRLLKDVLSGGLDAAVSGLRLHGVELRTKGLYLVDEVPLRPSRAVGGDGVVWGVGREGVGGRGVGCVMDCCGGGECWRGGAYGGSGRRLVVSVCDDVACYVNLQSRICWRQRKKLNKASPLRAP